MKRLIGELRRTDDITDLELSEIFSLLNIYFTNVNKDIFIKDLSKADYVILLHDSINKKIKGFSTQTLLFDEIDNNKILALYSGDTIIDEEYLGTRELPKIWGHFIIDLLNRYKDHKLYWFLISKGYMTYLLMPRYMKEFYPRHDNIMPSFEKKVLDKIAYTKFKEQYDSNDGLIRIKNNYFLKKSDIDPELLKNKDISFFIESNPDYTKGVELACIVPLTRENMNEKFSNLLK